MIKYFKNKNESIKNRWADGIEQVKLKMKKLFLVIAIIIGFLTSANAQQAKARVPGEDNFVIASISNDSQTSSSITFYNNSTKTLKVCVSVLNDQGNVAGKDCYEVPGASAQGNHTETTETLSKHPGCRQTTSGCEAKSIKITSVTVQN